MTFWASAFLGAVVVPNRALLWPQGTEHIIATARPKVFITTEHFGTSPISICVQTIPNRGSGGR